MGLVTDVFWTCPKCETKNKAQLYGWYEQPDRQDGECPELPRKAIPSNAELKWNPPCTGCGEYKMSEPPVTLVEFPIVRVDGDEYADRDLYDY